MLKERERHADHRSAVTDATVITKAMYGQKQLKREATDVDGREPGTEPPVDARVRLLPPFDLNAAHPQDVFPFDKLIPVRILEALASEAELLSTASVTNFQTWSEKGVYPKCVIDRLLRLSALCNTGVAQHMANNRLRIAQCLTYLSHMLALFKLNPHDVHRKQPLPDSPSVVAKHLLAEFTAMVSRGDSSRFKTRTISPLLRDRLIYHMLTLVLHCDNFKTVIDDLTVDFRMSCDQLRRYFVYIGCRVHKEEVSAGDEKVTRLRATLTTPVKFPDASWHRNRRMNILD
ncbi:DNA-directed RNA polymerase I subunit RPA49 [Paragonimus westermani]|uniref:DNA-directed RNA polymerase I subunit RPA49 n=1 Tax=Paragonimus westermani TaxID=34504 RepID=A0A5J4NLY7_9TREM|nr:DNA-directed RNA polymerase I subunit RPA49 [Paragonimus westermani]